MYLDNSTCLVLVTNVLASCVNILIVDFVPPRSYSVLDNVVVHIAWCCYSFVEYELLQELQEYYTVWCIITYGRNIIQYEVDNFAFM